jgi:cell division protein FtsN
MLRWVIWLLVIANVGYFAWSQGHLGQLGLGPAEQREPERLNAQIHPEAQRLLNGPKPDDTPQATTTQPGASAPAPETSGPASVAPTPDAPAEPAPAPVTAPAPPVPEPVAAPVASNEPRSCWQASVFNETQADTLRAALTLLDLPSGSWTFNESRSGGRWIVYMGRYDNDEQLDRKKAELRDIKVSFREVSAPGLSPGLALGTYSSEAAAEQALKDATKQGVRTAQVAQERAESRNFTLRLPSITAAQRSAVANVGSALAGKSLERCN